ncbi:hypothetical protein [Neosynechococcus sphagnicola]|uniref:hypothetical protein n=1 Tax=Neosynechococcus sphagnicola TaxID=1501145 RepID=UPI000A4BD778|nr:hypothetical protein [Neosynechococcus sphagnicola]
MGDLASQPPLYPLNLVNAKLPGSNGLHQILINDQGLIQAISPMSAVTQIPSPTLDVGGDWISLGGVGSTN